MPTSSESYDFTNVLRSPGGDPWLSISWSEENLPFLSWFTFPVYQTYLIPLLHGLVADAKKSQGNEQPAFLFFYIEFYIFFSDFNDGFENATWNVNVMFTYRTLRKEVITKPFSIWIFVYSKKNPFNIWIYCKSACWAVTAGRKEKNWFFS